MALNCGSTRKGILHELSVSVGERQRPLPVDYFEVVSDRVWPRLQPVAAQGLANEGFAADVSSPAYGADFLLRAAKVRGRNLRSPRITYTT